MAGSDYSKTFSPQKQTWQLLADQLFRLVFTAILVALTIITLKVYEQKGPVAHDDKIVFNTVITVLNLALGLNFLVSFIGTIMLLPSLFAKPSKGSFQRHGQSTSLEGSCQSQVHRTRDRSNLGR